MFKYSIEAETFEELKRLILIDISFLEEPEDRPLKRVLMPLGARADAPEEEAEFNQPVDAALIEEILEAVGTEDSSVQVDAYGVDYDETIHSANKSFNKDGTWRLRRGTDKAEVKKAAPKKLAPIKTAQARQAPVPQAVPLVPPPPPSNGAFYAPAIATTRDVVYPAYAFRSDIHEPMSYTNIEIPQKLKPAHSFDTFRSGFYPCIGALINENVIGHDYMEKMKKVLGVVEIFQVLKNETQLRLLFDDLCSIGAITKVD